MRRARSAIPERAGDIESENDALLDHLDESLDEIEAALERASTSPLEPKSHRKEAAGAQAVLMFAAL